MPNISSGYIIGHHGCDKGFGLRLINGGDDIKLSDNSWDWLGEGIYFWEDDPTRALQYVTATVIGKQKNKKAVFTPFVVGAVIDLGRCLNLVEAESLQILSEAYERLLKLNEIVEFPMPINKGKNRALDCTVINFIHLSNKMNNKEPYDSVRCAFPEDEPAFPGSTITDQLHIQLCVRSPNMIKGYFLPKPINYYKPNL